MTNQVLILYINLDTATERRQRMESDFAIHNVNAQRLDAVKWSNLSSVDQSSYYSEVLNAKQYHTPLVNGEKGCYASHIQAWRFLLSSDADCMVVLEDDVYLATGFSNVVNAVSALKAPWDMVKLLGREHEKVQARRNLIADFELIDYARVPSYTAGYVVSRQGAEKMLRTRVPFGRPIDVDLRFWWENDLTIYGVWPSVLNFDETSDTSTIAGRKSNRNLQAKWRKFKMKILLTFGNTIYKIKRKQFPKS